MLYVFLLRYFVLRNWRRCAEMGVYSRIRANDTNAKCRRYGLTPFNASNTILEIHVERERERGKKKKETELFLKLSS